MDDSAHHRTQRRKENLKRITDPDITLINLDNYDISTDFVDIPEGHSLPSIKEEPMEDTSTPNDTDDQSSCRLPRLSISTDATEITQASGGGNSTSARTGNNTHRNGQTDSDKEAARAEDPIEALYDGGSSSLTHETPRVKTTNDTELEITQDAMDVDDNIQRSAREAIVQHGSAEGNALAKDGVLKVIPALNLGSSMLGPRLPGTCAYRSKESRDIVKEHQKKLVEKMTSMYKTSVQARTQNTAHTDADPVDAPVDTPIFQGQQLGGVNDMNDIGWRYAQAKRENDRRIRSGTNTIVKDLAFMQLIRDYQKSIKQPEDERGSADEMRVSNSRRSGSKKGKSKSIRKSDKKVIEPVTDDEEDHGPRPTKKPRNQAAGRKMTTPKDTAAKAKSKAKSKKTIGRNVPRKGFQPSNVIDDAQAAENLNETQPSFNMDEVHGNRAKALRQLVNNVPEGSKKTAQADKVRLDKAIKHFSGQGVVKPAEEGKWLVKGMKTSLEPHQVLATGFMRKRETEMALPRGGILADQMGLGKTLMSVANVVNGRPDPALVSENPDMRSATLIVVPSSLLSQWNTEIKKHTVKAKRAEKWGIKSVLVYRERDENNNEDGDLDNFDIVLTTYNEVSKSWPVLDIPDDVEDGAPLEEWMNEHFYTKLGILHRTQFLRVILDEAHNIRNVETRISQSCCNLKANHYWPMTGTPMVNGVADLFALFKFIRHPSVDGGQGNFKRDFVNKQDPMSTDLLSKELNDCMTRATHRDQLFGARLVKLPKTRSHKVSLHFSRLEQEIYNIVRTRFRKRVMKISKEGKLMSSMPHLYVLMLRLRQLTSHPLMIQGVVSECLEREDLERLEKISQVEAASKNSGAKVIRSLRNMLVQEQAEGRTAADHQDGADEQYVSEMPEKVKSRDLPGGSLRELGGKHGQNMRFDKYLDVIKDSEAYRRMNQRTTCTDCHMPPENPQITSCYHIYCKACLEDIMYATAENNQDKACCKACGQEWTSQAIALGPQSNQDEQESAQESSTSTVKGKKKKDAEMQNWTDLNGEVLPSTKTIAIKAQVMNWWDIHTGGDPEVKIIIFTQWRGMISVLSKMCTTEGWGHCTLTGDDSQKKRDKELSKFRTDPNFKILIASLRCGGIGLNLTCASKVIVVEPYWNDAIEQQAFCRVFRIGQTRETSVLSLSIKGTVDDTIFGIKEKKTKEIDGVMLNQKERKKLELKELLSELGEVDEDENGQIYFTSGGMISDDSSGEQGE